MYLSELDIANRSLQHLGEPFITSVDEDSRANTETTFAYDKLRRAEMRRNIWRFSIRRAILRAIDTDTMLLQPDLWDAITAYPPAAVVRDANGIFWQSMVPGNTGNDPTTTVAWDRYFGPATVHKYDSEQSYYAGELVWCEAGNAGGYVIFRSLVNDNGDDPEVASEWNNKITYNAGETVSYGGYHWRSLIEVNLNITPAVGPLDWDENATYATAQTVTGSDGFIYSSIGNGNVAHNPVTDGGVNWTNTGVANAWKRIPTIYASSGLWQPLFASMSNILFAYPIGTGPLRQNGTSNVYRLPVGYLRQAHPDPKQGSVSWGGAPGNLPYDDKLIEGQYIIGVEAPVAFMRFAADISDVREFDDMFSEGLAARIAIATCEPITQSSGKMASVSQQYQKFMGEARIVNAIETGPEEPYEDSYIAVRA